jgi:dTDP-glucose 4,6-dehydratase
VKNKVLITGGAGFIASNFVHKYFNRYQIVVVDKITYAGDLRRIEDILGSMAFYKEDIVNKSRLEVIFKKEKPQNVIHFAAETHVDRSILNVHPFILTNITGTQNLLDLSRQYGVKRFIHISTDEVYGASVKGRFKENSLLKPNNPYAATKTAAEFLVRAAIRTHGFPAIIIRPSNNYGPWQYPEKFVPVIILKAMNDQRIPVYGKGEQIREWLHVSDCSEAIHAVFKGGKIGEIYNIGSCFDRKNIETARFILRSLGKSPSLIEFVKDRPGHDFRYSVDCTKVRQLGWKPKIPFNQGMRSTIQWYHEHQDWHKKKLKTLTRYWKQVYRK